MEVILAEAALANAQLAEVKAVMQAKFRREGATADEVAAKAEEVFGKMVTQLVFGQAPMQTKAKRRRGRREAKVIYFHSLFEAEEYEGRVVLPSSEQPVQPAMFAT